MKIEVLPYYGHVFLAPPYTHSLQWPIGSLGTFYNGLRVPDLMLTVHYYFPKDPKATQLDKDAVKLIFQADGPTNAQLEFTPGDYKNHPMGMIYYFSVNMKATFGLGATVRRQTQLEGTVGAEKVVKAEVTASYGREREGPDTVTTLFAAYSGEVDIIKRKVRVKGEMRGSARQHRTR